MKKKWLMMKRFFIFLLFLLVPILADAEMVEINGIYYEFFVNDKTALLSSGRSCSGDVVIPASVEHDGITYTVTYISSSAFEGCSNLTSINIPESVTSIGERAFQKCECLISINTPSHLESIANYVFTDCSSLTSITLPESVTCIGEYNQEIKGETNVEIIPVSA